MHADRGTSILASLTAQVMDTSDSKSKANGRVLTPVGPEARPAPALPTTKVSFPNDMPQEVVETQIKELDRVIAHLTEARDALATLTNASPAGVVDLRTRQRLDAERKEREREADAAALERAAIQTEDAPVAEFDARLAEMSAAAQAAAFGDIAIPEPAVTWACPDHGKAVEKTSPKGSTFVGCPDCNKFQR